MERHGVCVGRPLGVEGHGAAVGGGEVADALAVVIGGAAAVGFGVPTGEGVARAVEGVGGEVLCCAVGEALVAHLACGIGVVLVELHGVGVEYQFGGEGHVAVGAVHLVGVAGEGVVAGLINDVFTSGAEVAGERQLEAHAVVGFVVIDEAVVQTGGGGVDGGGDAADAAAEGHLAGGAYVGAGTTSRDSTDSFVKVALVVVEVLEGGVVLLANDGAFVASVSLNIGVDDHTVLNSGISIGSNSLTDKCTIISRTAYITQIA